MLQRASVAVYTIVIASIFVHQSIGQSCQQEGCPRGYCCSDWGFCGDSELHCAGRQNNSQSYAGNCNPPCRPGTCCSRWGSCGDSPLHCAAAANDSHWSLCQPPCAPGFCCSKWGFCGDSPLHCASQGNITNGGVCNPPCGPGYCCSKWGFCGDSPLHCADSTNNTTGGVCNPPCGPGYCCSKWGFCGDSPLHCAANGNHTTGGLCNPPCGPGYCCSKWGFCGDSLLHCAAHTNNTTGGVCNPPCGPGYCCSKWGYCGNTPLHCAGSGTSELGRCPPPCAPGLCCSKWGYCGSSAEYCNSKPDGGSNETTLTRERFDCIFDQLDPATRDRRWRGFQEALAMVPFPVENRDELMMFLSHVSHESDGLITYEEYCGQSGACAGHYQDSWCPPVEGEPGKYYYGRGWFQLSWPCNYHAAGQALGVDLLKNPELVAESDTLAAATALWFWNANNMGQPAREGNFAGTTQIINSIECGSTERQINRIRRYQKVRRCFGLPEATDNLQC